MRKIAHSTSSTEPIRYRAEFDLSTVCSPPAIGSRKAEIDALSSLQSDALVYERLRDIAGAYGKVESILSISSKQVDANLDPEQRLYLVDFERAQDASEASADTGCYLFGFSALAVPVRMQSGRIEAPDHRYTH